MIGVGIIISTGFIHVFMPAIHIFEDACFPQFFKNYEAWPALLSLFGFLVAHIIHLGGSAFHSHDYKSDFDHEHQELNQKSSAIALEFGIAMHSILIGMTLGTTSDEFVPLLIAICFHQLFEGLALSSVLFEVRFMKSWTSMLLVAIYVLSTPVGIALGMLLRNAGNLY